MKKSYFYLRFAWLVLLLLTSAITAMGYNGDMTEAGIKYGVFITGDGEEAVADSAWVIGHNDDLSSSINISSSVSYMYKYKKYVNGYLREFTRLLSSCPVTRINDEAFSNQTELSSVSIPGSINYIGRYAFSGCTELSSVSISGPVYFIGISAFSRCSNLTSITLPNTVKIIGSYAFFGCNLTNITLPDSVKDIGIEAFSGCPFTSITIPYSVTVISDRALVGCPNLKSLIWKAKNVSYFPCYTEKYIGNNGKEAYRCNIEDVFIENGVEVIPRDFLYQSKITEVNIPNTVTTICDNAFSGIKNLKSVIIPNSVTNLSGFNSCPLTGLNIPNSVTTITNAFNGCYVLRRVNIPNSVTNITNAFNGNGGYYYLDDGSIEYAFNLRDITIGESVNYMENSFNDLPNLKKLTWNAINCTIDNTWEPCFKNLYDRTTYRYVRNIDSLIIGNEVEIIPDYFLNECDDPDGGKNITTLIIPNSVKVIGEGAFYGLDLEELTIGNSVTTIGAGTFEDCSVALLIWNAKNYQNNYPPFSFPIKNLVIGADVESIGDYVFRDIYSKYVFNGEITCLAKTPPAITYYCFNAGFYDGVLYVPKESLEAYQQADGWKEFYRIEHIEPIPSADLLGDVNMDGIVDVADIVALIDYVLGKNPDPFDVTVADLNGDGIIDVADVVLLINKVLNGD